MRKSENSFSIYGTAFINDGVDVGDHPSRMCFLVVGYGRSADGGDMLIECITTPYNEHVYLKLSQCYCILPIIFHNDHIIPICDKPTFKWWMDNSDKYASSTKYDRFLAIFSNSPKLTVMLGAGQFHHNQTSWFGDVINFSKQ